MQLVRRMWLGGQPAQPHARLAVLQKATVFSLSPSRTDSTREKRAVELQATLQIRHR